MSNEGAPGSPSPVAVSLTAVAISLARSGSSSSAFSYCKASSAAPDAKKFLAASAPPASSSFSATLLIAFCSSTSFLAISVASIPASFARWIAFLLSLISAALFAMLAAASLSTVPSSDCKSSNVSLTSSI